MQMRNLWRVESVGSPNRLADASLFTNSLVLPFDRSQIHGRLWRGALFSTSEGVSKDELRRATGRCQLPIRIGKTEFQIVSAGGAILYDAATKRSRNAEESFRVRGRLVVSFAGTDATIDLEEQQNFKLTFTEPGQRKLVGQPFPQSP